MEREWLLLFLQSGGSYGAQMQMYIVLGEIF